MPQPSAEEPRGLGWLLSMSGLGAETPVPDTSPLAEPESSADVTEDTQPTGWFAPGTDDSTDSDTEAADTTTDSTTTNEAPTDDTTAGNTRVNGTTS
ncbi:hypothetical protein, partial [Actinoplanes regularis]|uniref:hypothetical protein n=1 Tax=Actinoplanes regularis TaxID=52697 RepID=UPI00255686F3